VLLLVDGSSYVYRAFHALPDLRTATGFPTAAIRGVISMLERLVETWKPTRFAVVMDAPGKTFRHEWYQDYKAHRPSMPEDLSVQLPVLLRLIEAHGWPLIQIQGVEADDVIGTLAIRAQREGESCVISTGDKDLAQLVQPGIQLINTMTNEQLDEARVFEKFGVYPHQIIDYLTLVGDTADNIPGIPKVGPKTAAKWLDQYGSLDELIANAHTVKGAVGESLRAGLEWLPQAKRLVSVICDLDLPLSWQNCVCGHPNYPFILEEYTRLEFKTLLRAIQAQAKKLKDIAPLKEEVTKDEVIKEDLLHQEERSQETPHLSSQRQAESAQEQAKSWSSTTFERGIRRIIVEKADLYRYLDILQRSRCTAFDTETTSLNVFEARLVGLSFAVEGEGAVYIPVMHIEAPTLQVEWVLSVLKPWFESEQFPKVAQHAKYDRHILANYDIHVKGIIGDTLLQSYVLSAHLPHGLDRLAERYLAWTLTDYEALCGKGAKSIPFSAVPLDKAAEYACDDAEATLYLYHLLNEKLAEHPELKRVYETIELPVERILWQMERQGIRLDPQRLYEQSASLERRLNALELDAHTLAGKAFNLASPKQIQTILFEEMKLPIKKRTPKGQPSTDEEVLEELASDYPLPKLLLEHRTLSKLKTTYTDKLPLMMDAADRVHTHYNQTVAVTGRLSSSEPNLQNIPIRTAEGRKIRQAFIASEGYTLIAADYSQIELRIMAHLSNDPHLLEAFARGDDIHRATAADIFNVPPDQVTAEQRRYIKAINFGLMYGMSSFGLAIQLGIDRASAQRYIDHYFDRYTGVKTYLAQLKAQAHEQGYVETVFGRRLYLPELSAKGPRRAGAERAAINAPMQGTAADLIKLAMIAVQKALNEEQLEARLLLQVHDELVLEAKNECVQQVVDRLPSLMCNVTELKVPLMVEIGVGNNWEAAH
jgi:DNA polymerase I